MVVHVVNEEIVFRAYVRWTHVDIAEQSLSRICRFQIEATVADKAKDNAVAIDAVVAEHFLHCDFARTSTLVGDVLNEVGVACHIVGLSFVIAQRYKKKTASQAFARIAVFS